MTGGSMMSHSMAVTTATFEDKVLKSPLPVLVDVWANWCPPCRRLLPVIEAVADKYAGRLQVVKCDHDTNAEVVSKYNILSIPTLLWFRGGELVGQDIGFMSESQLAAKVEEVLAR